MYNKQTWKDEIPDLTKPVLDANGKQKTDPQTGRPLFELVQEGTRITSTRLNNMETGIGGAHELTELLSKELGGNFVVSSEGGLGIKFTTVGLTVSWSAGVAYVGGRRFEVSAGSLPLNPTQGQYLYLDLDGKIKKTTSEATAITALLLWYVATDTSGVITSTDKRSTVNMAEILKRIENITVPPASLTQKGIVQLSNATNGTRETVAATEKAIKQVSDTIPSTAAQITIADSANYFASTEVEGVLSEIGSSLSERTLELTNPVGKTATINAGTQVIQGGVAPAIAFPKVGGRTLINRLGDTGDCELLSKWIVSGASMALDPTTKTNGMNSMKVTLASGNGNISNTYPFVVGNNYVVVADFKVGNVAKAWISVSSVVDGNFITDKTSFKPSVAKFKATSTTHLVAAVGSGAVGQYFNSDSIRVYEVSAAEYTAIDTMTADQIAAKYPFVGTGIYGVKDVTVTSVQDNLLPPFSEWGYLPSTSSYLKLINPYGIVISNSTPTGGAAANIYVPAQELTNYVLSIESITGDVSGGEIYAYACDVNKVRVPTRLQGSFSVPLGTKYLEVVANTTESGGAKVGTFIFTNPMLVKGTVAQPFKAQSRTSLTAYTELYSNTDGTIKDTLEYVSGKPKKLKRFGKIVLDGASIYTYGYPQTGFKSIRAVTPNDIADGQEITLLTKYDGKLLSNAYNDSLIAADQYSNRTWESPKNITMSIATTDSGWGDAYTPTAAEIKAYFYGWILYDGSTANPYTTGTKYWRKSTVTLGNATITDGSATLTLPTASYSGYNPYQLLYQLTAPITEDVQTSGAIVLESGDNYVTATSTNVPIVTASISYADSFYSALSDAERSFAVNNGLFGGMKPDSFIFGDTGNGSSFWGSSANSITKSGFYYITAKVGSGSNLPIEDHGYILHEAYPFDLGYAKQTYTPSATPNGAARKFFRVKQNGTWQVWVEVYTSGSASQIPLQTTANLTYYVNAATGNDANDGLTAGTTFKTIQKAINLIPQIVNHGCVIYVTAGTYMETISLVGFMGKGSISIYGANSATTTHNVSNIILWSCTAQIIIQGFNITTISTASVDIRRCASIVFVYMSCVATTASFAGFYVSESSVHVQQSTISNKAYALYGAAQATIVSTVNAGSNNAVGLSSSLGSTIAKNGSQQPSGVTAEYQGSGGVIR